MFYKTRDVESVLDLGTLHYEKGALKTAVPYLEDARTQFLAQKKVRLYFETSYKLLRAYLEMEDQEGVLRVKKSLQGFVLEESVEMSSKLYYTLGICAYLDNQSEMSLRFFNQSFNMALSESNKVDMCYALLGKGIWYKTKGDYDKAFSIFDNLKVFFESVSVPEVEASVGICEAQIFNTLGNSEGALKSLWEAYATSKKAKAIHFMNAYILIQFGRTYMKMGKYEMAENYFSLADSQIKVEEHVRTYGILSEYWSELKAETLTTPDIEIDLRENKIKELHKGSLELNNQFILLELLVELVKSRGSFLTKEDLAERLWKQDYDPSQHDNKIYVTVRRLRKLIEPDPKNPHYVLRTKNGYQINSSAAIKVLS